MLFPTKQSPCYAETASAKTKSASQRHVHIENFNALSFPLTYSLHSHRIPPNMNKHGLGTMTMTTTSGKNREAFVLGKK